MKGFFTYLSQSVIQKGSSEQLQTPVGETSLTTWILQAQDPNFSAFHLVSAPVLEEPAEIPPLPKEPETEETAPVVADKVAAEANEASTYEEASSAAPSFGTGRFSEASPSQYGGGGEGEGLKGGLGTHGSIPRLGPIDGIEFPFAEAEFTRLIEEETFSLIDEPAPAPLVITTLETQDDEITIGEDDVLNGTVPTFVFSGEFSVSQLNDVYGGYGYGYGEKDCEVEMGGGMGFDFNLFEDNGFGPDQDPDNPDPDELEIVGVANVVINVAGVDVTPGGGEVNKIGLTMTEFPVPVFPAGVVAIFLLESDSGFGWLQISEDGEVALSSVSGNIWEDLDASDLAVITFDYTAEDEDLDLDISTATITIEGDSTLISNDDVICIKEDDRLSGAVPSFVFDDEPQLIGDPPFLNNPMVFDFNILDNDVDPDNCGVCGSTITLTGVKDNFAVNVNGVDVTVDGGEVNDLNLVVTLVDPGEPGYPADAVALFFLASDRGYGYLKIDDEGNVALSSIDGNIFEDLNNGEMATITFGYTAEDIDNDMDMASVTIKIDGDSSLVAQNDAISINEDDTLSGNIPSGTFGHTIFSSDTPFLTDPMVHDFNLFEDNGLGPDQDPDNVDPDDLAVIGVENLVIHFNGVDVTPAFLIANDLDLAITEIDPGEAGYPADAVALFLLRAGSGNGYLKIEEDGDVVLQNLDGSNVWDQLKDGEIVTITFDYTAEDEDGDMDVATATIEINGESALIAQNDTISINEDDTLSGNIPSGTFGNGAFSFGVPFLTGPMGHDFNLFEDNGLGPDQDPDNEDPDALSVIGVDNLVINVNGVNVTPDVGAINDLSLSITEIDSGEVGYPADAMGLFLLASNAGYGYLKIEEDGDVVLQNLDGSNIWDKLNNGEIVTITFDYTAEDEDGDMDVATATIEVNGESALSAQNDAFVIQDDHEMFMGNLFDDNGNGPDNDPDNTPQIKTLTEVKNDFSINVAGVEVFPGGIGDNVLGLVITLAMAPPGAVVKYDLVSNHGDGFIQIDSDGKISVSGDSFVGLFHGEDALITFGYTVEDSDGDMAMADVTVLVTGQGMFCEHPRIPDGLTEVVVMGSVEFEGSETLDELITGDNEKNTIFGDTGGNGGANSNDVAGFTASDDWIFGEGGNDKIFGDAEDDVRNQGVGGDDFMFGGSGNNTIVGDAGDDVRNGGTGGNDHICDGDGNGRLYGDAAGDVRDGSHGGNDIIYGFGGNDKIFGDAGGNALFENKNDSPGNIKSNSSGGNDMLYGGEGNDIIYGDAFNDITWEAVGGDDYIEGNEGNDMIFGDAGEDVNDFSGGGNDIILGGDGNDTISGDAGNDISSTSTGGDDDISGGKGNDIIYGDAQDDITKISQGGDDILKGDEGDDILIGDAGDKISGDGNKSSAAGNDTLIGGLGDDHLWGDAAGASNGNDPVNNHNTANAIRGDSVTGQDIFVYDLTEVDPNTMMASFGEDTIYDYRGVDTGISSFIGGFFDGDKLSFKNVQDTDMNGLTVDDLFSNGLMNITDDGSDTTLNFDQGSITLMEVSTGVVGAITMATLINDLGVVIEVQA